MTRLEATAMEDAIAADLPIIDVHHHFWGESFSFAKMFGRYLPEDLAADVAQSGHRLLGSVYVDCGWAFRAAGPEELRCVGETEYVEAVGAKFAAQSSALGAGIVARADLMLGDAVGPVLDAHMMASPTRLRGVRELLAYDPEAFQMLNIPEGKSRLPSFRAGLAQLARRDLSLDVMCVHPMLDEIVELARASPETSIIVNHFGYPLGVGRFTGRREEVFADWRRKIATLAACENVTIKLSGVGGPVMGFDWSGTPGSEAVAVTIEPYVAAAVDAFSPARCMFASNFPVDRASFSYGTLWNAFKRVAKRYSSEEQHALFHENAERIYRLALR